MTYTPRGLFPQTASGTKPPLPKVGDVVALFGVMAQILAIEPEDDWHWHLEGFFLAPDGTRRYFEMILPTDYRTDTGMPAIEEDYNEWIKG